MPGRTPPTRASSLRQKQKLQTKPPTHLLDISSWPHANWPRHTRPRLIARQNAKLQTKPPISPARHSLKASCKICRDAPRQPTPRRFGKHKKLHSLKASCKLTRPTPSLRQKQKTVDQAIRPTCSAFPKASGKFAETHPQPTPRRFGKDKSCRPGHPPHLLDISSKPHVAWPRHTPPARTSSDKPKLQTRPSIPLDRHFPKASCKRIVFVA